MPNIAPALNEEQIAALSEPGNYSVGGVLGLKLFVGKRGQKQWWLRVRHGKATQEHQLGVYPQVSLSDARSKARKARQKTLDGWGVVNQKRSALKGTLPAATPPAATSTAAVPNAPLQLAIELDGRPIGVLAVIVHIPEAVQQRDHITEQHVLHTLVSAEFKTWYANGNLVLRHPTPAEAGAVTA